MTFELDNGATVQWVYKNAFENCVIQVVKAPEKKSGCGNPWNMMTEQEAKLIRQNKPKARPIPSNMSCILENFYFSNSQVPQLIKTLTDIVYGDTWSIFETDSKRQIIISTLFDLRLNKTDAEHDENAKKIKGQLVESDFKSLFASVQKGNTVVFVLGRDKFQEVYFSCMEIDKVRMFVLNEINHI